MGNHEQLEAPKSAESKHEGAHLAASLDMRQNVAMSAKECQQMTENLVGKGVLPDVVLNCEGIKTTHDQAPDDSNRTKYEYPNGLQVQVKENTNHEPGADPTRRIILYPEGAKDDNKGNIVDKTGHVIAKHNDDGSLTIQVSNTEYVRQDKDGSTKQVAAIRTPNGKDWTEYDPNSVLGDLRPSARMSGMSH